MIMKDTKIVAYLFFVLLLISCSTTSTTKCIPKETIYGTWVDTENNGVKITSDILPLGAELFIDENLCLKIYPLVIELKEDIEIIYAVQFKKLK